MLEARQQYDEFDEYNQYPIEGTTDERLAFIEKRESLQDAAEKAEKKAQRKVAAFGELAGCEVKYTKYTIAREIKNKFYRIVGYVEEMEYRLGRIVETYNEFNH